MTEEDFQTAWGAALEAIPAPVRHGVLEEALLAWVSDRELKVALRSQVAVEIARVHEQELSDGLGHQLGRRVDIGFVCDAQAFRPLARADEDMAIAQEAAAAEIEQAREVGELAYYARILAQATIPHRRLPSGVTEYVRRNGQLELTVLAPSRTGIPYGSIPRLLLAWVTTEAVRTREPRLVLGTSMAKFMQRLDLCRTGGPRGDITRLRNQAKALFSSTISATFAGDDRWVDEGFRVASRTDLWWDPRNPDQDTLWESSVTLTREFFGEITRRPVPVDMDALRSIKDSPMAIDAYVWMAHRMSYLKKDTLIPWQLLELQFGAGYARTRDFRRKFALRLREVGSVYPAARWELSGRGLRLHPSSTPVRKLRVLG
ncbi:MAG: replication protein RepA [Candidatus Dormibacteraeota bacterium]|jgi:hypothetical protein|nr:replication protein RepA [Candidatus Dormibacteraeota bacterium]